jgi:hypothetical protein
MPPAMLRLSSRDSSNPHDEHNQGRWSRQNATPRPDLPVICSATWGLRVPRSPGFSPGGLDAEDSGVEFAQCPYDASPIEHEAYSGGSTLLACSTCGAAWEWHNTWLRRLRGPDHEAVRLARAGREPVQVFRDVPDPASSDATWHQVTSSSASISHASNTTPPT